MILIILFLSQWVLAETPPAFPTPGNNVMPSLKEQMERNQMMLEDEKRRTLKKAVDEEKEKDQKRVRENLEVASPPPEYAPEEIPEKFTAQLKKRKKKDVLMLLNGAQKSFETCAIVTEKSYASVSFVINRIGRVEKARILIDESKFSAEQKGVFECVIQILNKLEFKASKEDSAVSQFRIDFNAKQQ